MLTCSSVGGTMARDVGTRPGNRQACARKAMTADGGRAWQGPTAYDTAIGSQRIAWKPTLVGRWCTVRKGTTNGQVARLHGEFPRSEECPGLGRLQSSYPWTGRRRPRHAGMHAHVATRLPLSLALRSAAKPIAARRIWQRLCPIWIERSKLTRTKLWLTIIAACRGRPRRAGQGHCGV